MSPKLREHRAQTVRAGGGTARHEYDNYAPEEPEHRGIPRRRLPSWVIPDEPEIDLQARIDTMFSPAEETK
jgi:hypothetical protein